MFNKYEKCVHVLNLLFIPALQKAIKSEGCKLEMSDYVSEAEFDENDNPKHFCNSSACVSGYTAMLPDIAQRLAFLISIGVYPSESMNLKESNLTLLASDIHFEARYGESRALIHAICDSELGERQFLVGHNAVLQGLIDQPHVNKEDPTLEDALTFCKAARLIFQDLANDYEH